MTIFLQPKLSASARQRRGGFTLIEMVITLVIITLIIGAAIVSLNAVGPKKELMQPAVKMKVFARKAIGLARNTQRPHSIFMNSDYFVLRETHMREDDVEAALGPKKDDGRRINFKVRDEDEEQETAQVRVVERFDLIEGMRILVKRYNDKEWRVPKNEDWNFYTSGISDPMMIRFETDKGFIEMDFNPLTGKLQMEGERFEIYNKPE
ncbi:MAG: prepilin-type N-terminal cleavage/methylation domain-containing protein [Verrucomicrobiales bacterium]|jgi:prepilin-type N-terminal cleavage/methylation domain-containing protein